MMTRDEARALRAQIERAAAYVPESEALNMPGVFPTWDKLLAAGTKIAQGTILNVDGALYITVQAVTPQAHQRPDSEGMLAIYRPVSTEHAGTQEDPIPWVYGMDCRNGTYYSHNGKTYLCKSDMMPCVWEPGTAGLWQWELVEA